MSTDHPQRFVYFFGEGQADGGSDLKHLVGGKGASLADMTKAQLRVPPGFTISAECCDLYFRRGKLWPDGLDAAVRSNLDRLEKLAGRPFGQGDDPLLVAVRSGAAQSMPGMMDTVLNVGLNPDCVRAMARRTGQPRAAWDAYRHFLAMFGHTVGGVDESVFTTILADALRQAGKQHEDELDASQMEEVCNCFRAAYREQAGHELPTDPWAMLCAAINAVFNSWNNDRAVAYRQHHGIQGLLGTAVTVQMMCPSEVSGVMFTADPVNAGQQRIIIESSYGLGEAIVLGKVTPDRFVLDKSTLQITERAISHKDRVIATLTHAPRPTGGASTVERDHASLTDAQLVELARLGLRVEEFFHMPCDIEWALSRGEFYLLQARSIKGLEDAELIEEVRRETIAHLQQQAGGRPCAWVMHNLAETLPRPTPMTWDVMRRFMSGAGGYGRMYQDLGFEPGERVKQEGFLDLVCGRIYLNTQRHAEMFWGSLPLEYDLELVKKDPAQAEAMPTRVDPTRAGLGTIFKSIGVSFKAARSRKTIERLKADFDRRFNEQILPPYLAYVQAKRTEDLGKLDDAALVQELEARYVRVMDEFGKEAIKLSYLGGEDYAELSKRLKEIFGDEAQALVGALGSGLDNDKTVEANLRLHDVATGKRSKEEFLKEFGHRASQEFELSQPRWREDPSFIDSMIDNLRSDQAVDPHQLHEKMKARRAETEKALPERLKQRGAAGAVAGLAALCERVRRYMPYRETAKHYLLLGYELLRLVLLEIDRRKQLQGGVFFLHYAELPELMAGRDFRQQIANRRERRRAELRVDLPELITSDQLEAIGRPVAPAGAGESLPGTAVAPGSGTGPAAVVFDPAEARGLAPGYILVCPSTDPGWTPLFVRAAGLIMERGGILSHGAVVARDLGIPAVVIKGATQGIKPGETIRVDGNAGIAYRVRKASPGERGA
jgi:pyruvate,water dikinase